jgi:hypothetical protein
MIIVGYFLARCSAGNDHTQPPSELGVTNWEEVYPIFYERLGEGRDLRTFRNSLQNVRDAFDSHVENGRRGWYKDGKPAPLPWLHQIIFDRWRSRDDRQLWAAVQPYISG